MKLSIRYFAQLREHLGRDEETLELPPDTTPTEILHRVVGNREESEKMLTFMKVAINGNYESFNHPLGDGDELVFIPPVAGG